MFRLLMLPFQGRCIAKGRYIKILLKFLNHYTDIKYYMLKVTHGFKYILKIKIQIKIL
jgi:hypothetical protein